jgi:hypothetical protein
MNSTSTAWPGPQGDTWDTLAERLENYPWDRWHQSAVVYTEWALAALPEVVAYANELSDTQLAALEADYQQIITNTARYGPYGGLHWSMPESHLWGFLRAFHVLKSGAKANLDTLWTLGGSVVRGAGLAAIAQGVAPCDAVDFISGPWLRAGHPLPRTDLIVR